MSSNKLPILFVLLLAGCAHTEPPVEEASVPVVTTKIIKVDSLCTAAKLISTKEDGIPPATVKAIVSYDRTYTCTCIDAHKDYCPVPDAAK